MMRPTYPAYTPENLKAGAVGSSRDRGSITDLMVICRSVDTMIFEPETELVVEHINRAENGLIYHLGWSRYMDREKGDQFLEQLRAADCG